MLITSRFPASSPVAAPKRSMRPLLLEDKKRKEVLRWVVRLAAWVWGLGVSVGRAVVWGVSEIRLRCRCRGRRSRKLLVLDLDGTLILAKKAAGPGPGDQTIYANGSWFLIIRRPSLPSFLSFVQSHFDLVVFTASQAEYALRILRLLKLEVPLFSRERCVVQGGRYVKDLRIVEGDLSKVIILDDNADSYRMQPLNGVPIRTWKGEDDGELLRCIEVLRRVEGCRDVRDIDKW